MAEGGTKKERYEVKPQKVQITGSGVIDIKDALSKRFAQKAGDAARKARIVSTTNSKD